MTLEELYLDNFPVVYGYLLSLSGDAALAEDLTAETFLRAMEKIDRYDGTCKPSTWLCAIGKNLFYSERRRQRRTVPLEQAQTVQTEDFTQSAMDRELARAISREAQQLPELQRQVFFLRCGGLSFRSVGEALGRTETWARVTFYRVKTKLLEKMEGEV